jgi:hypothetical protein
MARPPISIVKLTDTLSLSECHPTADYRGKYWLWDETRGLNLAMGAETAQDSLVQAITYYQKRLKEIETCYWSLQKEVDTFVCRVARKEDEE